MTTTLRPRRLLIIGALALAWCILWRDISAANIIAGLALAVAVVAAGVGTPATGGIRLVPLLRLCLVVATDLVKSTAAVALEILTPTDRTDEAIVAVALPTESRDHILLLVVAITLTPGTAVVDADPDTGTLYLHLLHDDRRDATVAHVEELALLAGEALPTSTRRTSR